MDSDVNWEFCIYRDYLEAMFRSGHEQIVKWLPGRTGSTNVEDRLGVCINYGDAESLLVQYRKGGIGPQQIQNIMLAGVVTV